MFPALALVGLWTVSAVAVQPPETSYLGIEPQRLYLSDAQTQDYRARQAPWIAFTNGEGAGWTARFDGITGTPHRAWGPGIDVGPVEGDAELKASVMSFLDRNRDVLGLVGSVPVLRTIARTPDTGAIYVDIDARYDHLAVWRGGVTLRFMHGRLVMLGADTYPDVPIVNTEVLGADEAISAAIRQGHAPLAPHTDTGARRLLLPVERAGRLELRRVWHVRSSTAVPLGRWESMVDAETGDLLDLWNTIRFIQGSIQAEYDARLGDGTLITGPLPYASVSDGTSGTYTDSAGAFELPEADTYTVDLDGERLRVTDELGDINPTLEGPSPWLLTGESFSDRLSPLTTWMNIIRAQDEARAFDPDNTWVSTRTRGYVNLDSTCNAYFDGNVNFFRSGDGCNNTGRLADVIFHEWGHGFHTYAVVAGFYDGSLGEGAADVYSTLVTGDSRIAPNFFQGGGTLRDVDNRQRWPADYVLDENYIHYNGLIYGGSMWDFRKALVSTWGEDEARMITGRIWARMLRGGPSIETAFEEAMFADDDNGDLSDGTPHLCELVDGFGLHGLGPVGGQGVGTNHVPIVSAAAGEPIPFVADVINPAPDCYTLSPERAVLHWQVNNGPWASRDLGLQGMSIRDEFPSLDLGDVVQYWFEVQDEGGGRIQEPLGGPIRPHTFYVGDVLRVHCEDFERNDGGFVHSLVEGEDVEGADDWTWGEPGGMGGDPFEAPSGTMVWGNDLGGGDYNGEYQNEKVNRLDSPVYRTLHYTGIFLNYKRWLTVEDGVYDHARILADGEPVWSNWVGDEDLGTQHHLDHQWADHSVLLGTNAEDGDVQLSWELSSDQGLTFGGWTIDDVCLYAPSTPDNRLGISDLVATRVFDAGPVALSWTQPRHAPVAEVVLVRKVGGMPSGPTDGEVMWRSTEVDTEQPITIVDAWATGQGDLYYAAYASDGQDWLSWTREGFNAASIDAVEKGGSCSCATPGSSAGWTSLNLVGLAALLGARRRRLSPS